MEQIVIGIDHGNGNIKTKHCVFPSGFKRQDTKPSELFSTDILTYRGNYYSLTGSRFPYEIDKTKNENCLILTLFAIAKELKERAREEKKNFDWKTSFGNFIGKDVVLAVGLPPAHLEKQQESFKKYFLDAARYGIEFHYNGKLFQFHIKEVLIFPQDYAAAVIYREALIKKYSSVYCIDIGDGTVDLLALKNGIPDKEVMVSRELGMAGLRAKIIDDVINDFGMTIDADVIEDILMPGREVLAPEEVIQRVKKETGEWAVKIVNQLHSKVADFRFAPTIFCGGGAMLLKPYLEKTGLFGMTDFISDIHANAIGYEQIAELVMGGQG